MDGSSEESGVGKEEGRKKKEERDQAVARGSGDPPYQADRGGN
jgi:hypothetical protein